MLGSRSQIGIPSLPKLVWRPTSRAEFDYANSIWSVFINFLQYCRLHNLSPNLVDSADFIYSYASTSASRMVTHLLNSSARTWREAARRAGNTSRLYAALRNELAPGTITGDRYRQLIQANADLISTFPVAMSQHVAAAAANVHTLGVRSQALSVTNPLLLSTARTRAKLIARTEVSKASTALTQARAESLSLPWYQWETSIDSRVRRSHRLMQDVLVQFDDPPSPELLSGEKSEGHYVAGDIYNCRCYPAPVVDLRAIKFPAKVYYGGTIQRMTLAQFRRISGMSINSNSNPFQEAA